MFHKRQFCIDKFSNVLNLSVHDAIILNLEKGIFNETINYCQKKKIELKWSNVDFLKKYSQLYRKIHANITYTPNSISVKNKILDGVFKADNVASMTHEQLFPEMHNELKLKIMAQYIENEEKEIPDGMFKCGKCKTMKTTYYEMQTRSADEPMTTFVSCLNCENRWKF
jgi:transcription elongation factor S-II